MNTLEHAPLHEGVGEQQSSAAYTIQQPFAGHAIRPVSWVERILAIVMIAALSPLLLLLWILVRATSHGPAIYRQERLTAGGAPFTLWKFRSMVKDAEKGTGAVWSVGKGDARVTLVGGLLRKLHLDELPQLVNIVRGEMSFVGPRPERPEIVRDLIEQIPGYRDRLAVAAGVTGLAQVNLPADETIECVKRKLELDLEYICTSSLSLDLRIIGCTALKCLCIPQQRAARWSLIGRTPRHPAQPLRPETPRSDIHAAPSYVLSS